MIAKILCVANLFYVITNAIAFVFLRFQTAAFWGNTATWNLLAQLMLAFIFYLSRNSLKTGWKWVCCLGSATNLITVALGYLFMNTFTGTP